MNDSFPLSYKPQEIRYPCGCNLTIVEGEQITTYLCNTHQMKGLGAGEIRIFVSIESLNRHNELMRQLSK